MTEENPTDNSSRLEELLAEYMESCTSQRSLGREAFIAQHPDFANELREFISLQTGIERVAAPLRVAAYPYSEADKTWPWTPELSPDSTEKVRTDGPSTFRQLGEFRLIREIGRGGMGVVYEAEQLTLRRKVALKVLPFAAAIDPRRLQRFKNEALAAANLRHDNIVAIYGVGSELGVHYYAMQLVEGQSLSELISDLKLQKLASTSGDRERANPPMEVPTAGSTVVIEERTVDRRSSTEENSFQHTVGSRRYFRWVATLGRKSALALHYAHEVGIVHRDIKPANLLIDSRGEIWITDFGLAQIAGDTGLTVSGEILGTLRYASPEQVRALPGIVDQRTDIYSLAATLYELLTLRPIFDGNDRNDLLKQIADSEPIPPRQHNPNIPNELETILLKGLSKSPSDRYFTAQDFADDLKRFLDDKPIHARRPTRIERARKWLRRHPSFVIAGTLLLTMITVGSLIASAVIHGKQLELEQAYHRERLRADEAESQYRLARRSVDELFRASEEELVDQPGTEPLRKRLLTSVLSYYREFIEQRPADEGGHTDLLEARSRVERILSDLAALRTSRQLRLLGHDSVLDDLDLDQTQRKEVKALSNRVDQQFQTVVNHLGRRSPAERWRQLLNDARQNESQVRAILTSVQMLRLYQISLQTDVSDALRDPDVAMTLQLTTAQLDRARMIEEELFVNMLRRTAMVEQLPWPEGIQVGPSANRRALAILDEKQLAKWREITGVPFTVEIPRPMPVLPKD